VVLSFDVEEHFRIEAAFGLEIADSLRENHRQRVEVMTYWLLERLAAHQARATFFIVGEVARQNHHLVRAIAQAGHEVASHSWDHQRLHRHSPASFREDVRKSKHLLEQITGQEVVGFRAPTFSLMRKTGWAIDILVEEGFRYDSSIYPVRHDRYGMPDAPRTPFFAVGRTHEILELPPLTLRWFKINFPVGGGGYFRLLPLWFLQRGIQQMQQQGQESLAMLYFHPWEFDLDQQRLPLGRLNRWRTYTGIAAAIARLQRVLQAHHFATAADFLRVLQGRMSLLPRFATVGDTASLPAE
jgi:polysaccharide deacetylase family protein (PEP-CTERM system associated)